MLSIVYDRQYKLRFKRHNASPCCSKNELSAWQEKWKPLSRHVNPLYFKLFSQYVGTDINIAPEDIVHNVVESVLNPVCYRGYYSDKNMYDKIFSENNNILAKAYFRKIDGCFYDEYYNAVSIEEIKRIDMKVFEGCVAKETIDTSSGLGVKLFGRVNGVLRDKMSGEEFSIEYLDKALGSNYIVQEYLPQSDFMAQFNRTSVNTLRICVYRSVKDNSVHVLNTVMRIGKDGALMDNAHQGGACIGVNPNGKLMNFLVDQYGNKFTEFNGIDFQSQSFEIPSFNEILDFARKIGESIMYHRLLNLDVMIDSNGCPRLIEFNIRSMGVWVYQYTIGSCFGEYTDEIIDYCAKHKSESVSEYLMI